jgi:hypothetical protein
VSDVVRFNRVEGLALGGGYRQRLGAGFSATIRARYGLEDRDPKGELSIGWQNAASQGVRLRLLADHATAGDDQERSVTVNSLAAQEFGSDYTSPFWYGFAGVTADLGRRLGVFWSVDAGIEGFDSVRVHATPARGRFAPTLPVLGLVGPGVQLRASMPTRLGVLGVETSAELAGRLFAPVGSCDALTAECEAGTVGRVSGRLQVERPIGRQRFVARTSAAAAMGELIPTQFLAFYGGPTSGPGYDFHALAGTAGVSQRLEWRLPVPFAPMRLGRFGRVPASATLAPYAHAVALRELPASWREPAPGSPGYRGLVGERGSWRAYPSVGVGFLTLFDLVRFDVARGLRDGRWTFNVDVTRDFWRIL